MIVDELDIGKVAGWKIVIGEKKKKGKVARPL
jgi:hypothetical protein